MERRETNKQARRERILDAAEKLLEAGGSEALTMRKLASEAGVSEATPYNLFGTKADIIFALMERSMASVVEKSFESMPDDPIDRLYLSVEVLTDTWTSRAALFRELLRAASESGTHLERLSDMPVQLLAAGLQDLAKAKMIRKDIPLRALARHIHASNRGAYQPWIEGEADDESLRRDLTMSLSVALLAVATRPTRQAILERLAL